MADRRIKKGEVMEVKPELLNLEQGSDTPLQSSAAIQAVYLTANKPMGKKIANVDKTNTMREHILKMSLFPSIY
jgi:hypothetical protein